jgi:hypothetical protein
MKKNSIFIAAALFLISFCRSHESFAAVNISGHRFGLELGSEQQEVYRGSISLYTPSFEGWGQFGLMLASKDYVGVDAQNGKLKRLENSEMAAVWRVGGELAQLLSFYSILRIGQSEYVYDSVLDQKKRHTFVEIAFTPGIDIVNKEAWVSRLHLGLGVSLRSNFIPDDELRVVAGQRIATSVLSPAFNVGIEF